MFSVFIFFVFTACTKQEKSYVQSVLVSPSVIKINKDNIETTYTDKDDGYHMIYQAIQKNWWHHMTSEKWTDILKNKRVDNMVPMKDNDKLPKVQGLSSKNELHDILIIFEYDDPVIWDNRDWSSIQEETLYIKRYGFMPPENSDNENILGYMVISENEELLGQFNEYVYYYNEDLYQVLNELGYYEQ